MIVKVYSQEVDYSTRETLIVDGKERQWVGPLCECPEDAIIGRSLVSCGDIARFMAEAHAAGARGEPLEIQKIEGEPDGE